MKELFSIGPVHIYFFGLMIAIGIIAALFFAIAQGKRRGIDEDTILNIAIIVVISGVLGARLFYVLVYNPSFYFTHPGELIRITEGGLSIHGGVITALAAGFIYCRKKKISFFKLGDIVVVSLALAQGIGRVGCDVFGKVMTNVMPWGIKVDGQILHPAQIYEFILDYILFIILWRRSEKQKYEGELFGLYLIAFPIIRGIVEFFRINPTVWGPFSVSHLLSLILMVPGIIILKYVKRNPISEKDKVEGQTPFWKQLVCGGVLIIISFVIFYWVQG